MSIMAAKTDYVVTAATELFLERPISAVTVKDIAKASDVGEATVYRYFSTKGDLVIACALKLQNKMEKMFIDRDDTHKNGFEALKKFYRVFLEIFKTKPQLYCFLSEFDAYCISENIENKEEYADNMDRFKEYFMEKYVLGVKEGSVRAVEDAELFYYATTHAILSLCKKLSVSESVIRQDEAVDKCAELETLINTVLFAIKAAV